MYQSLGGSLKRSARAVQRFPLGSPPPPRTQFASVTANDILRSLDLEPISDTDNSVSMSHSTDDSGSDTVSMGSSSDNDSDNDSDYSTDISDSTKRSRSL